MAVNISLSDEDAPASPNFVSFVAALVQGCDPGMGGWPRCGMKPLQVSERENSTKALSNARIAMSSAVGKSCVREAYDLFAKMAVGNMKAVREYAGQFRFSFIVGAPRTGGYYITGESFRALGYDVNRIPLPVASDLYPAIIRFWASDSWNTWSLCLQQIAEYLVVVNRFFGGNHGGGINEVPVVVPKKLVCAAYEGRLLRNA